MFFFFRLLLGALAYTALRMLLPLYHAHANSARPLVHWPIRSLKDVHRAQAFLSIGILFWAIVTGVLYRFCRNALGYSLF